MGTGCIRQLNSEQVMLSKCEPFWWNLIRIVIILYTVHNCILLNNELQIKEIPVSYFIIFYSLVKRHYSIYRLLWTLCSCTYKISLYNIRIQVTNKKINNFCYYSDYSVIYLKLVTFLNLVLNNQTYYMFLNFAFQGTINTFTVYHSQIVKESNYSVHLSTGIQYWWSIKILHFYCPFLMSFCYHESLTFNRILLVACFNIF